MRVLLVSAFLATGAWAQGSFSLFATPSHPLVVAQGGASAPLVGGGAAVVLNPAGVSGGATAALTIGFLSQDILHREAGLSVGLPGLGGWVWAGCAAGLVSYGQMEGREYPSTTPTGTYGAHDARLALALALRTPWGIRSGVSLARMEARVAEEVGYASVADVGIQYGRGPWEAGVMTLHGFSLSSSPQVRVERVVQAAVGWSGIRGAAMTLGARFTRQDSHLLVGLGYRVASAMRLAAGYLTGHDTAGLSWGMDATVGRLVLAYSFEDLAQDLGSRHRLGLVWHL